MCQPEYNPQIYILQLFSFLVSPFADVDAVPGVLLNPLLAWEGYRGFFSDLIVKKKGLLGATRARCAPQIQFSDRCF